MSDTYGTALHVFLLGLTANHNRGPLRLLYHQVRQMANDSDFFFTCKKLVLALLFVKPDGGFGANPKWPMCLGGALVLLLVGFAS